MVQVGREPAAAAAAAAAADTKLAREPLNRLSGEAGDHQRPTQPRPHGQQLRPVLGALPEDSLHRRHRLGIARRELACEGREPHVQRRAIRLQLSVEPALVGPLRAPPLGCIDAQRGVVPHPDPSLDDGPHHERADPDRELAELHLGRRGRERIIGCRHHPDAAADHLPVHPSQDELWALPHRVDQGREPQEEAGAALDVGDRGQLGEGRARAERTRALASKHDYARPWLLATRYQLASCIVSDLLGEGKP
jgi:hypothetical protein